PELQFVFEGADGFAADRVAQHSGKRTLKTTIQVARHAGDVRHFRKVELGIVRRFHVDAELLVKNRAADAVPVKPATKVALRQTIGRHHVMHDHFRNVEATNTGFARAQVPLAVRLIAQRAGFAAESIVKQTSARKCVAARYFVHAQWPGTSVTAKLERFRSEVEQGDHGPVHSRTIRKPPRTRPAPNGQNPAADEIAVETFQT